MRDALSNVTVAMVCSLHRQVRAGRSVVKCRSPVSCALAGEVRPCTGSRSVAQLSSGSGLGPRVCPRAPGGRLTRDTRGVDIAELTRKILDRRDGPSRPLRIVQAGHPALRHTTRSARGRLDEDLLRELVEAMTVTMRGAPGVGLAAPQVGLPLALFVMEDRSADPGAGARCPDMEPEAEQDVGDVTAALERTPVPLRVILDPTVEPLGTQRVYAWEGCLSVDGWQSIVPRSRRVRLQGTELEADGRLREIEDRKSTRLNSSHVAISYAVFCLKKKKGAGGAERRGPNRDSANDAEPTRALRQNRET